MYENRGSHVYVEITDPMLRLGRQFRKQHEEPCEMIWNMQMFDVCEYEGNDQCRYGYSALPATKVAPEHMTSQNESSFSTVNFQRVC